MLEVTIIGVDVAKRVFQLRGANNDGSVVFRKKLSRGQMLAFFAQQPKCVVAMEACATAHGWGRELEKLGHSIRLIPPVYVKPFVKCQKNDAADAAMVFRTRDLFVRQRTQTINALRAHLAEHGIVAPQRLWNLAGLRRLVEEAAGDIEPLVVEMTRIYLEQIDNLSSRIAALEATLKQEAARSDASSRMMTMPGLGPITAMAIEAFAPALSVFNRSRNFAAWLGLVPRQHSTGGKTRLGAVSKMGQCDIRKLLIVGAMSVIRWVVRRGGSPNRWLANLVARKPRMVATVALANKMARRVVLLVHTHRNRDVRKPFEFIRRAAE